MDLWGELTYHVVACIMYLSASLILLCEVVSSNAESDDFKEPGYEGKIAASALGLVNSILYGGVPKKRGQNDTADQSYNKDKNCIGTWGRNCDAELLKGVENNT
ncbi:hypothetical protein TNCT_705391 [Trichonephila clavata]|uniref:Uncharacterized protein n=1 Tax=Trichonephila clavata TaxID=2740835 RepID=A0A8X6KE27_TRICU|nr:hypothetical protein TNCT_705391 [Trichonephila clavata]